MSIRTTSDEVEAVLGPGVTITSGQLDSFIVDASLWVDNYMVDGCSVLDEDKLPTIEKYIAAHLFQMTQEGQTGPLASASRSDISESYASRTGDNASRTSYIMTAAAFDPCGIVAEHWLGKRQGQGSRRDGLPVVRMLRTTQNLPTEELTYSPFEGVSTAGVASYGSPISFDANVLEYDGGQTGRGAEYVIQPDGTQRKVALTLYVRGDAQRWPEVEDRVFLPSDERQFVVLEKKTVSGLAYTRHEPDHYRLACALDGA